MRPSVGLLAVLIAAGCVTDQTSIQPVPSPDPVGHCSRPRWLAASRRVVRKPCSGDAGQPPAMVMPGQTSRRSGGTGVHRRRQRRCGHAGFSRGPNRSPTAIGAFSDLLSTMRAFARAETGILTWIHSWDGSAGQLSTDFPGAHVTILSDATWITLFVSRVPRFAEPSPDQRPRVSPTLLTKARRRCSGRRDSVGCGARREQAAISNVSTGKKCAGRIVRFSKRAE